MTTKVWGTLALFGVLAVLFVGSAVLLSNMIDQPPGVDRLVVIQPGTAARLDAGEAVAIIPPDLEFQLRDRLVVENRDSAAHVVGPFTIGAGERLEKEIRQVASFDGFCTLHPNGSVTINVAPA
ncbi:MAG: hypothetical protein R2761_05460 [Acidimicrobiales bacterium]